VWQSVYWPDSKLESVFKILWFWSVVFFTSSYFVRILGRFELVRSIVGAVSISWRGGAYLLHAGAMILLSREGPKTTPIFPEMQHCHILSFLSCSEIKSTCAFIEDAFVGLKSLDFGFALVGVQFVLLSSLNQASLPLGLLDCPKPIICVLVNLFVFPVEISSPLVNMSEHYSVSVHGFPQMGMFFLLLSSQASAEVFPIFFLAEIRYSWSTSPRF